MNGRPNTDEITAAFLARAQQANMRQQQIQPGMQQMQQPGMQQPGMQQMQAGMQMQQMQAAMQQPGMQQPGMQAQPIPAMDPNHAQSLLAPRPNPISGAPGVSQQTASLALLARSSMPEYTPLRIPPPGMPLPSMDGVRLTEIVEPHENDVLCGRGGGTNNHIGNEKFRDLVNSQKVLYLHSCKRDKPFVSRGIVRAVRAQNPPGRFLQKDESTGFYYDIGDQKAREKTSQALREGAPEIRNQLNSPGTQGAGGSKKRGAAAASKQQFAGPGATNFSRLGGGGAGVFPELGGAQNRMAGFGGALDQQQRARAAAAVNAGVPFATNAGRPNATQNILEQSAARQAQQSQRLAEEVRAQAAAMGNPFVGHMNPNARGPMPAVGPRGAVPGAMQMQQQLGRGRGYQPGLAGFPAPQAAPTRPMPPTSPAASFLRGNALQTVPPVNGAPPPITTPSSAGLANGAPPVGIPSIANVAKDGRQRRLEMAEAIAQRTANGTITEELKSEEKRMSLYMDAGVLGIPPSEMADRVARGDTEFVIVEQKYSALKEKAQKEEADEEKQGGKKRTAEDGPDSLSALDKKSRLYGASSVKGNPVLSEKHVREALVAIGGQ